MKLNKRVLLIGLSLSVLCSTSQAEQVTTSQVEFNNAYQSYLDAVKAAKNVQQTAEQCLYIR